MKSKKKVEFELTKYSILTRNSTNLILIDKNSVNKKIRNNDPFTKFFLQKKVYVYSI